LNGEAALAAALRRERFIALLALLIVAAIAWAYVLRLADDMATMDTPEMAAMQMSMIQMLSPNLAPWSLPLATYLFVMWVVMMIGMMTPSAAPMVLLYLGVARNAASRGHRFTSSAWFFGGYLLAWCVFSLVATAAHWALESAALMTPAMRAASVPMGAAILIAAGLYQWLPIKDACLNRCRAPLQFIQQHGGFQPRAGGSLGLGFTHGLYCVGCCWLLMLVLFVVGVMNILWIAALMIFVLAEKTVPGARWLSRIAGAGAIIAGSWMLGR